MLHSNSQAQYTLVRASQRNLKIDFRSRDGGKVTNATSDDKDKLFCDRLGILGKLFGDFMVVLHEVTGHSRGGTRPRANHTLYVETMVFAPDSSSLSADTGVFSKEEVDTLHRLMSQLETSSSFTHTNNLATTLNASATHCDDRLVIDLGASDHITDMSCFLHIILVLAKKKLE
jgi:hypothetical protein